MFNNLEDIHSTVISLCHYKNSLSIDYELISNKIHQGITENMDINDFYKLFLNTCDDLSSIHNIYSELGAYILSKISKDKLDKLELTTFVSKVNYINERLPTYLNQDYVKYINDNGDYFNTLTANKMLPENMDLFGYRTLEGSYLIKVNDLIVEEPADIFLRVAISIHFRSKDENKLELIKESYELMFAGYFTHATPTLYNAGTNHEQLSSCYLLGTEDSLDGIFKTFHDAGKISKWSGGIGIHVSNIRAKGSKINSTNGESSGLTPMLKVYNDVARYINQGGRGSKRPGAIAIYLEPWHADVEEFLELKLASGSDEMRTRDLFLALWIPDLFMKQLEINGDWFLMCPYECPGLADVYGDEFEKLYWHYVKENKYRNKVKASDIFIKITTSLAESGVPYILFKDNINKKSNQSNIGTIKSSNLCVHEDTMIFTKQGYKNIKSLKDTNIEIWNGKEWSNVLVRQTGTNQNLIRVNFSNGTFLDCTPEHKFYIQTKTNFIEKRAHELIKEDKLIEFDLPEAIEFDNNNFNYDNLTIIPNNYNINTRLRWFENYCDKNGIITNESLQVGSIEKEFVVNVRYMLHTLGIESKILNKHDKTCWTLIVNSYGLHKLYKLGFRPIRIKIIPGEPNIHTEENVTVENIEQSYQNVDTYCFTETKRHMGIFNGILTGQCAEITEVSSDSSYAVCNLASIAVNRFLREDGSYDYEKLRDVSRIITRNLNNVIDINYYPTKETSRSNLTTRPIGIGIQGLGNLLLEKRIPYESNEALEIEYRVMETIYYGAMMETIDLSRKYGSYDRFTESPFFYGKFQFDLWDDKKTKMWDWEKLRFEMVFNGTRNSMLTALMPTASTSQILGNMECFEPITSNLYIRKTSVGTFKLVNKHLIKDLEKLGLWNEEMKNNIILNNGSVQRISNIPEELKLLYKTVWEIKQKWVIDHALARAPFVDQSQSMNLYFEKIDINKVRSALFYGWKKGIKTGSYYMRSQPASNAGNNINRETTECSTCSA